MATCFIQPALANQEVPDTPVNHWIFEALISMKRDGLGLGIPLFVGRGYRPPSTYEFAVATHLAYENFTDKLEDAQREFKDLAAYQSAGRPKGKVVKLQSDLEVLKLWKPHLRDLKRLAKHFARQLSVLQVNVPEVAKDIAGFRRQVDVVESRKLPSF